MAPARLVVNFCERVLYGRCARDNGELAHGINRDNLASSVRAIDDADARGKRGPVGNHSLTWQDAVSDAAQEQIAPLRTDERRGQRQVVRQLLLPGEAVLINLLGDCI